MSLVNDQIGELMRREHERKYIQFQPKFSSWTNKLVTKQLNWISDSTENINLTIALTEQSSLTKWLTIFIWVVALHCARDQAFICSIVSGCAINGNKTRGRLVERKVLQIHEYTHSGELILFFINPQNLVSNASFTKPRVGVDILQAYLDSLVR